MKLQTQKQQKKLKKNTHTHTHTQKKNAIIGKKKLRDTGRVV